MRAPPMRVAMVGLRAPWGTEGGVEAAVGELAPRLVDRGCQVTVLCRPRYNPHGSRQHRGVTLLDVPTVYSKHLEAFVHTGAALPAAVARADLVHLHACGPALWSWLPRLAGKAVVVTIHGLDWQRDKWGPGARLALRAGAQAASTFPHEVIAVGHHLVDWIREHGGTATWIPNGVAAIPPVPLEEAGIPGLETGRFLMTLGRVVPEKGLPCLLDAYGRAGIDLPLLVVGGDTYSEAYAARLRRQAPPGVRFVGPRYDRARDALLTHARALVSPSRLEGFPLSPLESLSAGRPVVLSDIPPHRELIEDVGGGWLVENTVASWVAALQQLAAAPDGGLDGQGTAGRAGVEARYGWDAVADRTLQVYRTALRRAP